MNNLLTSLVTKMAGSNLFNDVGGRIFLDDAPQECEFPYIVFFIVSGIPDDVFAKKGKNILIQFSLFSASLGATEITTIYNDLHSLFDDSTFSITSNTLVWCHEQNLTTMVEDITVADATQQVKHWAVDYEINTQVA